MKNKPVGGYRPGAGRKVEVPGRIPVKLQLTERLLAKLNRLAKAAKINRSAFVRRLIERE